MTEILTEPVSALNAWRGDELADAGGWLIRFTEEDFADFERALGNTVQGLFCCAGCPSTTGSVWTRPPLSTGQWAEHPEYLPILNKNFPTDWRSEEPPGSPGWYLEPLYSYFGGALSATVRTGRAMSAMRFPEVPRLAADEVSCFTYFDSLAKRPGVALGMELQTGDLQFVNNFATVHTRTAFVDDAEDPARQRHLLRLWISRPETGRPLCPEYAVWRGGYPT